MKVAYTKDEAIDFFELLSAPEPKKTIIINIPIKKSKSLRAKSRTIVQTVSVKERKIEIQSIKDELYLLVTTRDMETINRKNISINKRREELIYSKKIIKDEVNMESFIFSA